MNAIVVVDQNWAIGRNNGLVFSVPGASGGTAVCCSASAPTYGASKP